MIRDGLVRVSRGRMNFAAALLGTTALAMLALPASAQDASAADEAGDDAIVVTGIRSSLATALGEKRTSNNIVEVIQAEDIGKLPDQNLAEVLENVTGVQITRQAGVGNAVQIRGTDANRTEINGVSTVGSGAGRSGISFEDLPAALIASVAVPSCAALSCAKAGTPSSAVVPSSAAAKFILPRETRIRLARIISLSLPGLVLRQALPVRPICQPMIQTKTGLLLSYLLYRPVSENQKMGEAWCG